MADITRFRTRRTTTKAVPAPADLELSEQGYSFVSDRLYIKNETTGQVECIGGKAIVDQLEAINRLPIVQAALRAIMDTALSITGNLLDNASDPDGDAMSVVGATYMGTVRTLGVPFATQYGTMEVATNGVYTFRPNDAARGLNTGESRTEVFGYTVADDAGGRASGNFSVQITGTNHGPIARADSKSVGAGKSAIGNVLVNDLDYEGQTLSVLKFRFADSATPYLPGASVPVAGLGTFSLAANGAYHLTPVDATVHGLVKFIYTGTDGTTQYEGELTISIAPPAPTEADMSSFYAAYRLPPVVDRPAPNPVVGRPLPDRTWMVDTTAYEPWDYSIRTPNQTGRPNNALDFEVGPGKPYTEIEQVPWEYLLPGDRVFIYARALPYKRTIVISSSGTDDAWIEIIGVRDPVTGAKPVIDGDGATCASGRHFDIYDGKGLIAVGPFPVGEDGAVFGTKVRFIHITGFELRNANPTKQRYKRGANNLTNWEDFSEGVYVLGGRNICIQGNTIHHCGLGVFVNSTNHDRFQSSLIHICNNWVYACSSLGSYSTHCFYTEAIGTLYEHNFIQSVITGSFGDTIKERSSGVVFRYNYVETSANAISFRDPSNEDPAQNGVLESQAVDVWGERNVRGIYVYGNTFVNEIGSPQSIIGVGDGGNGELREGNLHFYSNVVLNRADGVSGYTGIEYNPYRIPLFCMLNTRSPITVHARNNLFYTTTKTAGAKLAPLGVFFWGGVADFQGNWTNNFLNTAYDTNYAAALAKGEQFTGVGLGGLTNSTDQPGFASLAYNDLSFLPTSPFNQLTAALHPDVVTRGLIPERRSVLYPFDQVPAPTVISGPTVTGSHVEGGTVSATNYAFTPLPDSYLFQWYDVSGNPISGATDANYVTAGQAGKTVTVGVRAVKDGKVSSVAMSQPFQVVTTTTPLNTTDPYIIGSGQVTFEHHVDVGAWTNSPSNYTYQVYLAGAALSEAGGGLLPNYIPSVADDGKTLQWMVRGINAAGESSIAMSNVITLGPVKYDPDNTGRFNFLGANGTNVRGLDARWNSAEAPWGYGWGYEHMTCQGGILQPTGAWTLWNRSRAWFENGQGDNCAVKSLIRFSAADRGASLGLRQTPTQWYEFNIAVDGVRVGRSGTSVASRTDMTITAPAVLSVVANGDTFEVYVNDVLALTYTDPAPLTGGFPGVVSDRGGNSTLECGWDWWQDHL